MFVSHFKPYFTADIIIQSTLIPNYITFWGFLSLSLSILSLSLTHSLFFLRSSQGSYIRGIQRYMALADISAFLHQRGHFSPFIWQDLGYQERNKNVSAAFWNCASECFKLCLIYVLNLVSANFLCKRPDSKYLGLCRPCHFCHHYSTCHEAKNSDR